MRTLPTTNANPPAAVASARKAVVEADGVWIFSPNTTTATRACSRTCSTGCPRPLEPFPAESASVMVGKKVALSAAAGQSAGAGTLAKLNEVLGFGKTELLPTDKQVGVALAPEAWGTGKLTLSDEDEARLAAEADAFLALVAE
ncbi:flavin reductase [Bifidobacterium breve]|nr:flavin reductase [Bifidobacterium breve]